MKHTKEDIRRSETLNEYGILQSMNEEVYDQITSFARVLCQVKSVSISFVANGQLWVKSSAGTLVRRKAVELMLTKYTMGQPGLVELKNIEENADVSQILQPGEDQVVFYAGIQLVDTDGLVLGAINVFDDKPKELTADQKEGLRLLVQHVMKIVDLNKTSRSHDILIESSRDMIYELNAEGKYTYANQSVIEKTGYSLRELKNTVCWDLVTEESREYVRSYYMDQIRKGQSSIYYEFSILSKQGKTIWLGQSIDFVFDKSRVVKAYAISKDITELVETRMQLKEREEQILAEKSLLKTMVFSAPAAIAMFNKDFKYLAFSELWMEEKEVNEQVIGLVETDENESKKGFAKKVQELILQGESVQEEGDRIVTRDNNEKWLDWVATPWHNTTDGSIGGIIVYTNDITGVVTHETELKQAKEEALESSKIKEEFLSSMSHEIRTPLNAIIGTTNLLMQENPELAENDKFKLLRFSSNNLLGLINNVLDYSKIESGNIVIEEKDFELRDLVSSLFSSWKSVAEQKDVELIMKYDDGLPEVVKGDAVRLSQVLNNLVNNALKFTQEGFVQLMVTRDPDKEEQVLFEVRDTGIGIPEDKHELVFQSFQQVSSGLAEHAGGTGLGLPICQKLLGLMGSGLQLTSKEGFGSRFGFSIKFREGNKKQIVKTNDAGMQQLDMHILLVEDNRANQFIASSFLEKWGVTLTIADNGQQALDIVGKEKFDLILMDIRMPVMDGYTAARFIREMDGEYYQKVPIIALTASTILDVRRKVVDMEFDGYLGKPFRPRELYETLVKYYKKEYNGWENEEEEENEVSLLTNEEILTDIQDMEEEVNHMLEAISVYTDGDADFFVEFTEGIVNNLEQMRKTLPKLCREEDIRGIDELVHMIKPSLIIIDGRNLVNIIDSLRANWNKEKVFDEEKLNLAIKLLERTIFILRQTLEDKESIEVIVNR